MAIPIIGAVAVHEGVVMATMTCHCQSGLSPFLIRGTDMVLSCAKCRRMYRIVKVEFDLAIGHTQPAVTVACVGTAPEIP